MNIVDIPDSAMTADADAEKNVENDPSTQLPSPYSPPRPSKPSHSLPTLIAAIGFSVAIVLAGGGIAYHFLVNIPARERAELDLRRAELDDLKKREERVATRTSLAEAEYQQCLDQAAEAYSSRWNKHCSTLSAEREIQYNRCVQNNYGESQYCNYIQRVPRADCQLPSMTASNYEEAHDREKRLCLEARNTTLGQT